jgi:hypothetical protein
VVRAVVATEDMVAAVVAVKVVRVVVVDAVKVVRVVLAEGPVDLAAASANFSAKRKSASSVSRRSI